MSEWESKQKSSGEGGKMTDSRQFIMNIRELKELRQKFLKLRKKVEKLKIKKMRFPGKID